jgi:hypothetical protein
LVAAAEDPAGRRLELMSRSLMMVDLPGPRADGEHELALLDHERDVIHRDDVGS